MWRLVSRINDQVEAHVTETWAEAYTLLQAACSRLPCKKTRIVETLCESAIPDKFYVCAGQDFAFQIVSIDD